MNRQEIEEIVGETCEEHFYVDLKRDSHIDVLISGIPPGV
jgi:hypothetical protein